MRGHAVVCGDRTSVLEPTYIIVISLLHWGFNEKLSIEFYVTEAYGEIRGMFGKSCVKAMKVSRAVAVALFNDFCLMTLNSTS